MNSDKLKHIAPNLGSIPKENPFETPENYFEDFEAKLEGKLFSLQEKPKQKSIIRNIAPYIAIAASFLLIFGLWNLVLMRQKTSKNQIAQDTALVKSIQNVEIDEKVLIDLASESTDSLSHFEMTPAEIEQFLISETQKTDDAEYAVVEDVSAEEQQAVIDYLLSNDIDLSTLAEEF